MAPEEDTTSLRPHTVIATSDHSAKATPNTYAARLRRTVFSDALLTPIIVAASPQAIHSSNGIHIANTATAANTDPSFRQPTFSKSRTRRRPWA